MGVYESDRYPFLVAEMNLIRLALQVGVPLLGICLGSQLIAAALGSNVRKGTGLEIGWHAVYLTEAASRDPLWHGIESPLVGFHWHGDVFDVPDGAVSLAHSEPTGCQAFRYRDKTYGILFHMEVTDRILTDIVEAFPEDLIDVGLAADQIMMGSELHLSKMQGVGTRVFSRWANLLAH